jgi:hypothetical protein
MEAVPSEQAANYPPSVSTCCAEVRTSSFLVRMFGNIVEMVN